MLELLGLFLVGLSLFFHGVGGIKTNVQGLTSRRLRQQMARWSKNPVLGGAAGFFFGAVTQSSTAVGFILSSLVSGGLLPVARALPVVAWANLGTAMLVFFASFNLHIAFLYLLGLAGLGIAFDLGGTKLRPALAVLFGVGVLFFGLQMMKDAFAPLPHFSWFGRFASVMQGSTLAAFAVGALLRLVIQSSSGIAVIAVALAHSGVLTTEQAVLMMYGTGLGVGLSVFLLSSNLRGLPKQIVLYQALITGVCGLALFILFYVEKFTGWPLALQWARSLAPIQSMQLAWAFFFLQALFVVISLATSRWAPGWLHRLSPPTSEQDLSRPHFLSEHALSDPESALYLAEKEQLRLLSHLPLQLDTVRAETAATAAVSADTLHKANVLVGAEVQAFLRELMDQHVDRATSERLLAVERRQTLVSSLDEAIYGFVGAFAKLRGTEAIEALLDNLVESLNTLVLTALDTLREGDSTDRAMLVDLTSDRGDMMERLRRNLLNSAPSLDHQQKANLFYLTSLFERAIWLLRQLGLAQQNLDHPSRSVAQS